jgi:hypothetical protein
MRHRLSEAERAAMDAEALSRAVNGQSFSNWPVIIAGFVERGIPEAEIKPRENVLTFHAWRARGRTVRRGEHGVRVLSYATYERKDADDAEKTVTARRPIAAFVFHVSQTEPLNGTEA